MMNEELNDDWRPHVYAVFTGPGAYLPDGLIGCAVCGANKMHREIRGRDTDLDGFLCRHCFGPMCQAEYWLRQTPGVRMPTPMEAMALEAHELGDEGRVA